MASTLMTSQDSPERAQGHEVHGAFRIDLYYRI